MPDYKVQVEIPAGTGFPEDSAVNTFTVTGATAITQANVGLIGMPIASFYNGANAGGNPLAFWLGSSRVRSAQGCKVDVYNITGKLDGSPHGSPVASDAFTLGAPSGNQEFPAEVSLALTLRGSGWEGQAVETPDNADPGTEVQRPRQRRTGKLYLGPIQNAAAEFSTGWSRPSAALMTSLLVASERLRDELLANNFTWCVWSRVDQFLYPISETQVDNAWDTQRRRGPDASARTTRVVFP